MNLSKWSVMRTDWTGFSNQNECFYDDARNVNVGGGVLNLTVRYDPVKQPCITIGDTNYSGGMITSAGKFAQKYGRFEFRAKFPSSYFNGQPTAGLQSALWLWPANQSLYGTWPGSGEIDVAEYYSPYPDRAIPFVHYTPTNSSYQVTNNYCYVTNADTEFHNYTLEWTPDRLKIMYDGVTCMDTPWKSTLGGTAPFDQPFFMSLTQGLGWYANSVNANTQLPATMKVDYVKVWK